jgi:hypothetical protein
MDRISRWIFVGAGAAIAVLFLLISTIDGLNGRVDSFLFLFAAVFAAYVTSLVFRKKSPASTRFSLLYIFLVASISRAVLVPAEPVMSTDIYRYVWEGKLITNGFNPFAVAPESPELEFLRDHNYEGVSHKQMVTIYPPLSQAVFALAAWIKPVAQTQKIFFVVFDLGIIAVLMLLLRSRGGDPADSIIYAWNPLVIFETGHSGHLDSIGLFFLMLALWLICRGSKTRGFVALGLSVLAKYLACIFIPFFLRNKIHFVGLVVTAVVVVAGYVPFAGAGGGLFDSLKAYGSDWFFNGLVYQLLLGIVRDPQWTRGLLALLLVVLVVFRALREKDVLRYGMVVIGAGLLLAPTLYPWYVSWIIPFLCFFPNRAWILFTGLVFVSYRVWGVFEKEGLWYLPWYNYLFEYLPFYGLLVYDFFRKRKPLEQT